MNIYTIIILFALITEFLLHFIAEMLNIGALDAELPDEFKSTYDKDTYRKSQEYTKDKTKFGLITSSFEISLTLLFWFTGGFNYLDQLIRVYGFNEIVSGLIYISLLLVIKSVFSIPFDIYGTFVLEEKYGFNKTTPATYISDLLKGLALSSVIGLPILAGVIAFFSYAGDFAWLYCWITLTIFSIFMQLLAPTLIMPIFNKFTPLEKGDLKKAIIDYADSVKFSIKDIFVMDGSKRSSKSNAFFTGFGKFKRIALFDTLIKQHSIEELVSVLAHEIGHYKKKHIQQGIILSVIQSGIVFFLLSIFLTNRSLFDAFYMQDTSIYAGLIFFGLLYSPIEFLTGVVMQAISRKNEYEADEFAAKTIQNPETMINTLKKLSVDNLSNLTPHPFYAFLNYSHPTVLERINAIRKVKV
ncbi:MAG: M48 family metallopeptidase [Candidatus Caenarcaniphilales bacterium]|nr:M48 family metallopeptidase [Candidatus Caenarcaniphilales bacterium]